LLNLDEGIGGRGPENFGGGLCFFGRPFGVGHNFMGPRLGYGYNFWAPFIKTLGTQMGFVLLTLAWQENLHRIEGVEQELRTSLE